MDELPTALKPIPAFRAASMKIERRIRETAAPLIAFDLVDQYLAAIREGKSDGHHSTAVGVVFHGAGIDPETTALAFASSDVQGQTAAAVGLGWDAYQPLLDLAGLLQPGSAIRDPRSAIREEASLNSVNVPPTF